ncbi:NmrA family transcriptional regulator [Paenibacillus pectinilyticus]|uniref:NmrA family transcriptional regulator n=1 Tax=Paenibacillus pectinilyticus TaxID=512399 RepID=A0A1C0ZZG1_9BACL|nr:NAD(P)H-binding protein [Paenibacillus pectinilyticus]OCT13527.1 NmrA family transcriptional regulator [Paenibacillus pectinilyticus]
MEFIKSTFLVFGATGRTGQHFVSIALKEGHKVRALVRNPEKMKIESTNLELIKGSISDYKHIDELLHGVDFVICMLGNAQEQNKGLVNTPFTKRLIPAMRRQGVKRFLYQAGGFTRRYKERLPLMTWIMKNIFARYAGLLGQHKDNEAVIEFLVEEAQDIDWIVHRASIISDGPSKGILKRDRTKVSLVTFEDCARYIYEILKDNSAIHTCDLSYYC